MIKIIYIIKAELPEGYEFLEEPTFEVKNNAYNIKTLTLIDKHELLTLLKQVMNVQEQAKFYNVSKDKQVRFNQALLSAQKLITAKEKQEVINREVNELKEKFAALDGAETNLTALTDELVEYPKLVQQANYYNADPLKQVVYDALVRSAKLLSSKEKATQAEVNQLLDKLSEARTALDGQPTNVNQLSQIFAQAQKLKDQVQYQNASTDVKVAFDQTFKEVEDTLNTPDVVQVVVDRYVQLLSSSMAALDDKQSVLPTPEKTETGNQTESTPEVTETAISTNPVVEESKETNSTTVDIQTNPLSAKSEAKNIVKKSEVKDIVLHLSDNKAKMSNSSNAQNNKQVLSSDKNVVKQKTQSSSQAELPQSGTKQSSILLGLVSLFVASITLLSGKALKTKE